MFIVRRCILLSLAFAVLAFTHPLAAAVDDPLWQKAVAIAGKNKDREAGRIVENVLVRDADGETVAVSESVYGNDGGELRVLRSVKNGEDNTANKAEELRKAKRPPGRAKSPFDPERQDQVQAERLERVDAIGGRKCRAFTYRQQIDGATWSGLAFLDVQTGRPCKLSGSGKPAAERDDVTVHGANFTVLYNEGGANDPWYAESFVLHLRITAQPLPLIHFEGTVRSIYTFTNYRQVSER